LILASYAARAESLPIYEAPTLPLERVQTDLSYTPATGRRIVVSITADIDQNGAALQAAVDSAEYGDVVILPAGIVYRIESLKLRKKRGQGWITIESASIASLPAEHTRVTPADKGGMPVIVSTGHNAPGVLTEPGAHNYRLVGLEVTKLNPETFVQELVVIDARNDIDASNIQDVGDFPGSIIIDRCYIHGLPGSDLKRGVRLHCYHCAVIDSYISDAHVIGQDSQALMFGGRGIKIQNNYLEGAAENLFGAGSFATHQALVNGQPTLTSAQLDDSKDLEVGMGLAFYDGVTNLYTVVRDISGSVITYDALKQRPSINSRAYWGVIPTDVEISHNYLSKPNAWNAADPSYAGYHPVVKNLFELKSGRRIWVHDNVLEKTWVDAQVGYAVLMTVRNETETCYYCAIEDVTFERNIVRKALFGMDMGATDNLAPSGPTHRVLIRNNFWNEIGSSLQVCGLDDLVIDHNTAIVGGFAESIENGESHPRNVFTNNIVLSTRASGFHYPAQANWDNIFPAWQLRSNVMSRIEGMSPYLSMPPNVSKVNYEVVDPTEVGFVDWTGGNFALAAESWARRIATDGTDLGAEVAALGANEDDIVSGHFHENTEIGEGPESAGHAQQPADSNLSTLYLDPSTLVDPNRPTTIGIESGASFGVAHIVWNAPSASVIEIHMGTPNGPLMVRDISEGSAATGMWVRDGTTFFLQDCSADNPLDERYTLAVMTVHTVTLPAAATGITQEAIFQLDPTTLLGANTIGVDPGHDLGTAHFMWDVPAARVVEIHVGSPKGPLMARGGSRGRAVTGAWVVEGMTFFLQDRTDSRPLDSSGTLGVVVVHMADVPSRAPQVFGLASFYLDPATIPDQDRPTTIGLEQGAMFGVAHLVWNAPTARVVEIHMGAPDGPMFAQGPSAGEAATDAWVRDGTTFFLQDRTTMQPLGYTNTLGVIVVHTMSVQSPAY
jgi:hypothetical protein